MSVNLAQRKRGKGRKGQRRIARIEQAEKIWPTPLEALLIAERVAVLTRRDEDFLLVIKLAYTGMRWSEALRMSPDYLRDDVVDIQWKLYEFKGRFYIGRPKDGSIRAADLPPFLAGCSPSTSSPSRAGDAPAASGTGKKARVRAPRGAPGPTCS